MAIEKLQIYKCSLCGNIVEVVHVGGGTLVCCGKDMDLVAENTTDAAQEKHVPVVEKVDGGYKVTVGSVAHPMEEAHLIQWVQLIADGNPDPPCPVINSHRTHDISVSLEKVWPTGCRHPPLREGWPGIAR